MLGIMIELSVEVPDLLEHHVEVWVYGIVEDPFEPYPDNSVTALSW